MPNILFGSRLRYFILPALICCAGAFTASAQCDSLPNDQYRVNSVKLNTLFGSTPQKLKKILETRKNEFYYETEQSFVLYNNQPFRGTSGDAYKKEVQVFFESEESLIRKDAAYGINQQNGLIVRSTFSSVCVKKLSEEECLKAFGNTTSKCVDVIIKYRVVPINTGNLSSNFLELARSNQVRFYRELPKPLQVFDPRFWIEQDKSYGTSAVGEISTDLLNLVPTLTGNPNESAKTQLRFELSGRKSFRESYYNADAKLSLTRNLNARALRKISFSAGFGIKRVPQAEGVFFKRSFDIGASAQFKTDRDFMEQITVGARYRRSKNSFTSPDRSPESDLENAASVRAIMDGRAYGGFYRAGVWLEHARPDGNFTSYSRFAVRSGFSKTFTFSRKGCRVERTDTGEQCVLPKKNAGGIGVETEFGLGRIWGNAPDYARFYGGNSTGSFLYDSPEEFTIVDFPSTALVRSFGRNELGASPRGSSSAIRGGTSYWNFNLSVSLPIRQWSRPLIPSEVVIVNRPPGSSLSCENCISLKGLLKNQVAGGKNVLIDTLAYRNLTPRQRDDLALDPDDDLTDEERRRFEEANRAFESARISVMPEAEKVWSRLTPAVEFIADKANLYSIKPLVLFDAANISASGAPRQRTRLALGTGLQFNVVVAKFETGYMFTVRRQPGDSRGNFFLRMVFEKLF